MKSNSTRLHWFLIGMFFLVLLWSVINPFDYFIWGLEVFPAIIGLMVVLATYRKFRLTDLGYALVTIHAVILMVGGHYTYAEMPLFNWLQDTFELQRNYYDRLGHIAQGFIPAIIAREILLRNSPLTVGKWLFFLVTCICLSISVCYEFLEWWVALLTGESAEAFLATQGDIWDTQWDMFLALCGALTAQLTLGRWHDRQLKKLLL